MKKEGHLRIFAIGIFTLLIFSLGRVSAENTCSDASQIILRLSDDTNAHAEVYNGGGNYDTEICYNQIFSNAPIPGTRVCTGENVVLKLSDQSNADAEGPNGNYYSIDVCYRDLKCTLRPSCIGDEVALVKLSSTGNAHLETSLENNYGEILCCSSKSAPGEGCVPSCEDGKICSEGDCVDVPTNTCGNGVLDIGEGCEGNNFDGKTCSSLMPGSTGSLKCESCVIDMSECDGLGVAECEDEDDNDEDGLIDFPDDPGCADSTDDDETDGVTPPEGEKRAYWANTNNNEFADEATVEVGDSVHLIAIGIPANMKTRFTVLDRDGFSEGVFDDEIAASPEISESNGLAVYRWNIAPSDFEDGLSGDSDGVLELYFRAEASGYNEISPTLLLIQDQGPDPDDPEGCEAYNNQAYVSGLNGNPSQENACNNDIGEQVGKDPEYSNEDSRFKREFGIGCNEKNDDVETSCFCEWKNNNCEFDSESTIILPDSDGDGIVCAASCEYDSEYGACEEGMQTIKTSGQLKNVNNCNAQELEEIEEKCMENKEQELICGASRLLLPFFGLFNLLISIIAIAGIYIIYRKRSQGF
ncbi:MAG: hypothetical protein Q7S27_02150 [Nanoarchaeota archaeon]|nr:hypothetical protein [Nanoarchaeota archaeon]